jgi:hypothetical protein
MEVVDSLRGISDISSYLRCHSKPVDKRIKEIKLLDNSFFIFSKYRQMIIISLSDKNV